MKEINHYPTIDESLITTASAMVSKALVEKCVVKCIFNGIELIATPDSGNVARPVGQYKTELRRLQVNNEAIKYEPLLGTTIKETACWMATIARRTKCIVETSFNDITLTTKGIDEHSIFNNIQVQYQAGCDILSEEYRVEKEAHEATPEGQEELRIKAIKEAERQKLLAEPMKVFEYKDDEAEKAWEAVVALNSDPCGTAIAMYAARWAWMMEQELTEGKALVDRADKTSHDANIDGITGAMYGCAVSILSQCWKHGEALRRWHNKETQLGDEGDKANESGGVLNPALLTIEV